MALPPPKILGVAWYRADQWSMLRALAPDGDQLEPTHAEWLKEASTRVWELEQKGFIVRKVDVELGALLRWCESNQLPPDAAARSKYAAVHT